MGKIAKVFKKVIPKKKKPAPVAVVKVEPVKDKKGESAVEKAARFKVTRKTQPGLGGGDEATISRPGARSATLLGE